MNKYQKGKIYKLIDLSNNNEYYGSTISPLRIRLEGHKGDYKTFLLGKKSMRKSGEIIKNKNFKIELVEDYPCNNDLELRMREQYYIDNNECINIQKAYLSKEDYYKRKRLQDAKRVRDIKPYLKKYREYQMTWGGSMNSYELNLLKIDPNLFI